MFVLEYSYGKEQWNAQSSQNYKSETQAGSILHMSADINKLKLHQHGGSHSEQAE